MPDKEFINIYEAKTHLSKLCAEAACGHDVILARHGQPWVRITALDPPKPKVTFGLMKGQFTIPDDFNDELPPDVQGLFEGD